MFCRIISRNTMLTERASKFFFFRIVSERSFFVTLVFVTLAALLFWLDTFRAYQSEMQVLVITKVPTVAVDQVVENFAELSGTLSFYERLLENNDLIEDEFDGFAKDKRKALWNETVHVVRSEKSGVLVVTAQADTPEKAKRLAEETVKTLFVMGGFYYNIKTDIDLRIVDGPIGKTSVASPFLYAATSFGSAFGVTVLFFSLLSITPVLFTKRRREQYPEFPIGASVPFIDPKKFVPARPTTLSFESSHEEQQMEEQSFAQTKSAAPTNLPTLSDERMLPGMDVEDLPFQFEETHEEETPVVAEVPVAEPVKKGEPTIEEYKRRLNELLAGGR